MGRILIGYFPHPDDLIHRTAVNGIFELISGIAVGFRPSDTSREEASRP